MNAESLAVPGLTPEGCRARQRRLARQLDARRLDAAVIADPRLVHYFTGFWARLVFARLAVVARDGTTLLVVPGPIDASLGVDEIVSFQSNRLGTLVEQPTRAALATIAERLAARRRLSADALAAGWLPALPAVERIDEIVLALRRSKDPDEVALVRRAIQAAEAAYGWVRHALDVGVDEVTLYAGMLAAATAHAGETLGEFGNDFQIGALGSEPRRRAAEAGEIATLDVAVTLRGYRADMCRSFAVDRRPSDRQQAAHGRVREALDQVERTLAPGVSCRELDRQIRGMLDGHEGWAFPHHLGHGIGLDAHEAPRINPCWDDTLQAGDVVAIEPGLYGEDLRAGLRIEQVYHVTRAGAECLTAFSTDLM